MNRGFTLVELLVTIAVLGLLAGTAVAGSGRDQAHLELEVALRRLRIGLDRGRLAAERQQQPCGLQLSARGWQAPADAALPACPAVTPLAETGASAISLHSNLPPPGAFHRQWPAARWRRGGAGPSPPAAAPLPGDRAAARHHPQRHLSGAT
ncbi:MAG: Tfp pilus assembly protein FimT/FimU [Parasynechococcus sp.]|uniref:pilus assembly FimT family protein n=1 Tax=Parasynechococcus sp. TaxID=3101203 RepID=UPI00388B284B